jgi:hypothetical protein
VAAQDQRQGSFDAVVFAMVEDEQGVELLPGKLLAGFAKLLCDTFGNVIDLAFGIGLPEPAETRILVVAQQPNGLLHFILRRIDDSVRTAGPAAQHSAQFAKAGIAHARHEEKLLLLIIGNRDTL